MKVTSIARVIISDKSALMIQQLYYGPVLCVFLSPKSDFMAFFVVAFGEGWLCLVNQK